MNYHLLILQVAATFDQTMRTSIIELILATDMKQHFSLISRFKVGGPWSIALSAPSRSVYHSNVHPPYSN